MLFILHSPDFKALWHRGNFESANFTVAGTQCHDENRAGFDDTLFTVETLIRHIVLFFRTEIRRRL